MRIAAGTTIAQANDELWRTYRKAFPILGGFDGQTMAGVFATGTHGSVLQSGPLPEMARSIDLVTVSGEARRIEPQAGITDPMKFAKVFPDWSLIQDDALFSAALIHLGSMGVITSYVVEVTDAFYLREVRTKVKLADAINLLKGGQVYYLFRLDRVPAWVEPDRGGRFTGHPAAAYHLELLINLHSDHLIVTTRDPYLLGPGEELGTGDRFLRPQLATWLQEHFSRQIAAISQFFATLIPHLTPAIVDSALSTMPDQEYINRSYRVFNIGKGANRIPALSATIFVPLRDDRYLEALAILRSTAATYARNHDRYQTGPVAMRFVRGSRAYLAPAEDVCAFEFIFADSTPWATDMVENYYRALRTRLGQKVWIHWGQLVAGVNGGDIAETYPRYRAWRMLRDDLDPESRFINDWLNSLLPAISPAN